MKDVTLGKMVDLKKTESLFIPATWIKSFNEEQSNFAIFLKSNPTMFRFIPTKTGVIKQFHMKLTVLEENFLQRLFQVFDIIYKDYQIKPVYSSGVCFVDDDCYYFFLIEDVNEDIEEKLKAMLIKLKGVEEIFVKKYNIN